MRSLIAVQTQYPASLGPALAARAERVSLRSIDAALFREKRFLKGWSVRATLHTALADDHMLMVAAVGPHVAAGHAKWMASRGVESTQLKELHAQILDALSDRPLGRKELHDRVPFYKGVFMVGWGLDTMGLAAEGKLILSRQAASQTEFARLDRWAPHAEACALGDTEAKMELMRRYFACYGPATYADFLYWSGIKSGKAAAAFHAVREELTPIEIDGQKAEFFLFGEAKPGTNAVRLLPKFDPLMMGWRNKFLFLPERQRERVFRKAGQVEAVLLAEGQTRGTWRTVRRGKVLEFLVEPFGKMKQSWLNALPREAQRTAKSLGFNEVEIRVVQA
jgi:hypothetical protein